MTKSREPGSIEDALVIIIGEIGFAAACEVVGKSESHVRGWTDPDNDRKISLEQALQLEAQYIKQTGRMVLVPYVVQAMEAFSRRYKKDHPQETLAESLMDVTAQVGQVNATVREALRDQRICGNELRDVLRGVINTRRELDELEAAARLAHSADKILHG